MFLQTPVHKKRLNKKIILYVEGLLDAIPALQGPLSLQI